MSQRVLRADGDDRFLFRIERHAVVFLIPLDDLLAKMWNALGERIAMVALIPRGFHQLADDGLRRRAVRVAHPEIHHIQLGCPCFCLHLIDDGEHVGRQLSDAVELLICLHSLHSTAATLVAAVGSWKLVRSPLLAIFLIVAVDVLGLTIMIPLLPFYAEKLGTSPTEVGWLIGIYAACQLFSGPLLGRMSDHTGRKPLLLVSQAGTFVGFLITAFAPTLWILFLARAIDGCTAGNLSLAQAYISDVTKPEDRAKSFGIIGIAFGLGFLIGPAVSGLLAKYDYRY